MDSGFNALTKMKWLRGTLADPFGWTAERKMERELITWFEKLLEKCCKEPMNIRGYGPVKEESVVSVKKRIDDLLEAL